MSRRIGWAAFVLVAVVVVNLVCWLIGRRADDNVYSGPSDDEAERRRRRA